MNLKPLYILKLCFSFLFLVLTIFIQHYLAFSTVESGAQSPEPSYQEIVPPKYERKVPPKPLPPPQPEEEEKTKPVDVRALVHTKEQVLISVENMPLSDFVIYVIGETLKVPFIMDEEVMRTKNPITLKMKEKMHPEKVLESVLAMIERHGIVAEERSGTLHLFKPKPKPKPPQPKPLDVRIAEELPDSQAEIIYVYPLKYLKPSEIEFLIREFYKNINIRHYMRENAFLMQGPAQAIKEAINLVKLFDAPYLQNKKFILLRLTYWQPEEFLKQITAILETMRFPVARSPADPGIYFLPIKYLNSLLVVAPDAESLNFVLDWVRRLDTAESAGTEEKAYIYTPKYSRASDLLESIKKLFMGVDVKPSPRPTSPAPQQGGKQSQTSTQAFSTGDLKMSADDKRNILLIMTTPVKYKQILSFLERLDVPPRQVLIEATVAELTLTDDLKYGLEWLITNRMLEGNYTFGALFGVPTAPGLTYTFLSDTAKLRVIINALATKDLVNILSSPRLMVLDNEEAVIQVGTDVPVVTGQVTSAEAAGTRTGVVQTIQYRSTGIILRVRPTVHTEGLLTLSITQEVSEMGSNPPGIASPSILVRKINTNVVASSDQSIVLGGLMSETQSSAESKVPILGDVPLLGNLFKSKSKGKRKTELIVILTPKIISTVDEATKLTEELKKELKWLKN